MYLEECCHWESERYIYFHLFLLYIPFISPAPFVFPFLGIGSRNFMRINAWVSSLLLPRVIRVGFLSWLVEMWMFYLNLG